VKSRYRHHTHIIAHTLKYGLKTEKERQKERARKIEER
jgi:hypothetical protein